LQAAVPEWEEEPVKDTESKAHYKDLHAKRPICNKIADTLKVRYTYMLSLQQTHESVKDTESKAHYTPRDPSATIHIAHTLKVG
jgi:hypothetical protein